MATELLKSFGNLQHELEEAKNSLKGVDENLKRLIGRDPSEFTPRNPVKRPIPDDKGRPKVPVRSRTFIHENQEAPTPPKRRPDHVSVFKRLSDKVPEDTLHGPQKGMISKVIVTNKEVPSREEAIVAQSKDEKFKARNRRMFGALLGTLQKFQQEETKLKSREEKRAQLEKKIEEHEIKERLEIKKERQELFLSRRKKQAEIKVIELKMIRMKEYAIWEESQKPRMNFIQTKAKPHIHYLPRRMNDKSKELLEKSKDDIKNMLEKKKEQIASELKIMEERVMRSFESRYGSFNNKPGDHNNPDHQDQDKDEEDNFDHDAVLTESQLAVEQKNKSDQQDGENETSEVKEHMNGDGESVPTEESTVQTEEKSRVDGGDGEKMDVDNTKDGVDNEKPDQLDIQEPIDQPPVEEHKDTDTPTNETSMNE